MAASARPGFVQDGSGCTPTLIFTSTRFGGMSAKVLRNPKFCLPMPPFIQSLKEPLVVLEPSCMICVLSESPGRGKRSSPLLQRFKLSANAGSEAAQKTPRSIAGLAATSLVLTYLCGRGFSGWGQRVY